MIPPKDKVSLEVDNSDNACDALEPKAEQDDRVSTFSSSLLQAAPKSAMDLEREEAYGKSKRIQMGLEQDDAASNMSSDTDVSQAYYTNSLKRSHSPSPHKDEGSVTKTKKTKVENETDSDGKEKPTIEASILKKINKKY